MMLLPKFTLSLPHPERRETSGCLTGGLTKEEAGTVSQVLGELAKDRAPEYEQRPLGKQE